MTTVREEIEMAETMDEIINAFVKRIDKKIENINPSGMFWDDPTMALRVLTELKEELKK
jgi:hypothetical protein